MKENLRKGSDISKDVCTYKVFNVTLHVMWVYVSGLCAADTATAACRSDQLPQDFEISSCYDAVTSQGGQVCAQHSCLV